MDVLPSSYRTCIRHTQTACTVLGQPAGPIDHRPPVTTVPNPSSPLGNALNRARGFGRPMDLGLERPARIGHRSVHDGRPEPVESVGAHGGAEDTAQAD